MMTDALVVLHGNLVRDPEFLQQSTDGGRILMKLAVAVNTRRKGGDSTAFYEVSQSFSQEAYARIYPIFNGSKGKPVAVSGDLEPVKAADQPRGYTWLNVRANRITALWSAAQQTTYQPVTPQSQPAYAAAPTAPDPQQFPPQYSTQYPPQPSAPVYPPQIYPPTPTQPVYPITPPQNTYTPPQSNPPLAVPPAPAAPLGAGIPSVSGPKAGIFLPPPPRTA